MYLLPEPLQEKLFKFGIFAIKSNPTLVTFESVKSSEMMCGAIIINFSKSSSFIASSGSTDEITCNPFAPTMGSIFIPEAQGVPMRPH